VCEPYQEIVPAEDLACRDRLEQERAERFAALSRISEAFADVPIDELEREVERAVAARRERAKATNRVQNLPRLQSDQGGHGDPPLHRGSDRGSCDYRTAVDILADAETT
jgi:hypothetical protein